MSLGGELRVCTLRWVVLHRMGHGEFDELSRGAHGFLATNAAAFWSAENSRFRIRVSNAPCAFNSNSRWLSHAYMIA
jgi:hypothetical protein